MKNQLAQINADVIRKHETADASQNRLKSLDGDEQVHNTMIKHGISETAARMLIEGKPELPNDDDGKLSRQDWRQLALTRYERMEHYRNHAEKLAEALRKLLAKLDAMTTEQFERGEEAPQRHEARAKLLDYAKR